MPYVITDICTKDGACVEVCPVACIHTTPESPQFYIDPDICIECEQCKVVCPVEAVFLDMELPLIYEPAAEDNAAFFRQNKAPIEQVSYEAAMAMVHASEGYARRMGHKISVVVVDGSGVPIAVSRMDGALPRTSELALNKAFTATTYALPTDGIGAYTRRPAFRSLQVASRGRLMAGGGGIPIAGGFGNEIIGAIGVAGGNNQDADILCSRAGLMALDDGGH
ncbi:MAG: heme-binding protein [Chloroflexota bacterium]